MTNTSAQSITRNGLVTALDVGSTKIACFIARINNDNKPEIIGIGHHVSRGVKSGAIVDMNAAEAAIRSTVSAAEEMAGDNIRQVVVNLSGGGLESRLINYDISIAGHEIGEGDLRRILKPTGLIRDLPADHELIHAIPVGYSIDGNRGIRDPLGMYGERLGVNMHVVTAASGTVRNFINCVARCHLDVVDKVAASYASAMACLVEDEKSLGVTCIDMGGGTTSFTVFFDGELVYADRIPIGGSHVTNDIARGLSTPLTHAERMKTLYGNALPSLSDDREVIKAPIIGEDGAEDANQVPRSVLVGIIRPRLEETFEMVRACLEKAGFDKVAGRRVVLTGGASQLSGVPELAAEILNKQVRLGRPQFIGGLADSVAGPAFSTCAGLLLYATGDQSDIHKGVFKPSEEQGSRFGRFGQWLREYF